MSKSRLAPRPLFIFASSFFLMGVVASHLPSTSVIVLGTLSALLALISLFPFVKKEISKISFPMLLGITLSVVLILCSVDAEKRTAAGLEGTNEECEMRITSVVGASSNFGSYYAKVISDGNAKGMNVSLSLGDGSLKVGDTLKCTASFEGLDPDEAARLASKGIFISCTAENVIFTGESNAFSIAEFYERLNSKLSVRLKLNSGGGLSRAVLLGNRDGLDLSVKRDFARLGISHLLAVSGLHLSILVAVCEKLLLRINVNRRKRCLIRIPLIVFYMCLTGLNASVMRAGIMHIVKALGDLIDRKSDGLTSLGMAVTVITLIDPCSFCDVGLILSAISAFACITFGMMKDVRITSEHRSFLTAMLTKAADTALLTVWICALTLPVTSFYFGSISLISPLTNVIYIPTVTMLLYLSLFHLLFCKIPLISAVSGALLSLTEKLIEESASVISHLPRITVSVNKEAIFICSLVLFVSLAAYPLVSERIKKPFKISGAVSALVIAAIIIISSAATSLTSDALYVTRGKSEGFVIRDGSGFTVIDASDGSKKMAYELYKTAGEENASEIDTLILTHLHSKHTASVDELTSRMIVRRVLLPEAESDADRDTLEKLSEACRSKRISVETYKRKSGESFTKGDVTVNFHDYVKLSRSTHPVITFDFMLDGEKYLYGGGSRSESRDFTEKARDCDLTFIGAHHPKTKDYTLPEISQAVISFAEDSPELREALKGCEKTTVLPENGVFSVTEAKK